MLIGLGVALWTLVTIDLLFVTLGAANRLSLSGRIAGLVFSLLRLISRIGGGRFISEISGIVVMVTIANFWIIGYWTAWTLIYASAPEAITLSREGVEPETIDRVAHVGHLLSTLGGATTKPADALWDWIGAFVGLNGMLALTISVSFLLGVRTVVQEGRAFASLNATGMPEPGDMDGRVADLVAGLHGAPVALWFGHRRRSRRVTHGLLTYARQAREAGAERWVRARALLADLPHFDARPEDEDFMPRLEAWCAHHEVWGPDTAEQARDRARRSART